MNLPDYYKFHSLNKKCYDIIYNHNIIHMYHNNEMLYDEFRKYDFNKTIFFKTRPTTFVDKIIDVTYDKLFLNYIRTLPVTTETKIYIHGVPSNDEFKLLTIKANGYPEALYKAQKYEQKRTETYFLVNITFGLLQNNYNIFKSLQKRRPLKCISNSRLPFGTFRSIYLVESNVM
jgi:hypothetical protein